MLDQIRNENRERNARYSEVTKRFSMGLSYTSRRGHKFVRKFLKMPTDRSVRRYVDSSLFTEGINIVAMKALETFASKMSENERKCALLVDEMAIKEHIFYDEKNDSLIGFDHRRSGPDHAYLNNEGTYNLFIMFLMFRKTRTHMTHK